LKIWTVSSNWAEKIWRAEKHCMGFFPIADAHVKKFKMQNETIKFLLSADLFILHE